MIYLIVIGFGLFSLSQLKIDFFPDIDFPIIIVFTNYYGVGPSDIENLVTRPLEEAVSAVKNVDKVTSQSMHSFSMIMLQFNYGTDMNQAEIDVRNRIDLIRDYLPKDATKPIVFAFDPSLMPILYLSLSSEYLGPAELRRLAEDKIEPLMERIEGVATATTSGGLKRQMNINLNPTLLSVYGLSPDNVTQAIQAGGGLLPSGSIETPTKNYNLRVFSEYGNLEQIENTIVTYSGARPIHVKDVADVVDGYKESSEEVRANYGQGVMMILQKQSDANTVRTCRLVHEAMPNILSSLPEGTKLTVVWDQSEFINKSINNLTNTAIIAFILAFFVIYLFLRNWRGSLIMGISIPVSIITTFAVLYLANLTLNIISMAGLALAVGMLVDNSIVALENIYRHREMGESLVDAADKGASEISMAITASTLTTVAVFLPVLFVPNITGQLFKDMVLTITFSLIVSLIVALTVVPVLGSRILHIEDTKNNSILSRFKDKVAGGLNWLIEKYKIILHWALFKKKLVLLIVFILFIFSIVLAVFSGGEFMPKSDQGMISFLIDVPAGSTVEKTRQYVYEIETIFKEEVPEMTDVMLIFGQREGIGAFGISANTIETFVKLAHKNERDRSQFQIEDAIRKRLDNVPGITYQVQSNNMMSMGKDIEVKVLGFDIEGAKTIANNIKARMENINGLVDINLNLKESSPELLVELNKDIMNSYGLSTMQVASNISTAIQGKIASQYREQGEEYNIYIQLDKQYRNNKQAIGELLIALPTGQMIQLKNIANVVEDVTTSTIFRENQNRYVSIECGLSPTLDLSKATAMIKEIIASTPIPSEYQVVIGGTAEDQQEANFYLMLAFFAAIILVYMIMAAQFESLVDSLIIIFTVPLSVIGVFFFLFITSTKLSVMALVGLVMLVGIAVNNGIVLVDYINQLRERGFKLIEAVEKGSAARVRPVLMTALTTILGMVPLALELGEGSETWSPLAKAVIGGLSATTFLTLLVIPVLYVVFEKLGDWIRVKIFRKAARV